MENDKPDLIEFASAPNAFDLAMALIPLRDEYRNMPIICDTAEPDGSITNIRVAVRTRDPFTKVDYVYDSIQDLLDEEGVDNEDELELDYEFVLVIS